MCVCPTTVQTDQPVDAYCYEGDECDHLNGDELRENGDYVIQPDDGNVDVDGLDVHLD